MGELEGRVALVTGGGSGIGAGCARRLAADAATVVIADFDQSAAERIAAEIGDAASAVPVDVRDPAAVDQLVAGVVSAHGRLDIALNIAGIGGASALPADYPIDSWRDVVDVNLSGVFYSLRAEVEAMLRGGGGSIINMASIYSVVGRASMVGYVAAKHGVLGLTRAAALDLAQTGVRVNCVGPSTIRTPLLAANQDEAGMARLAAGNPSGRIGEPEEVASLVTWLASDESTFVTGAYYAVDGGFTAR